MGGWSDWSLVIAASDGTAEAAGEQQRQRLDADQSPGHDDQPLPAFLKVLFHVFPAAVPVDPGRWLVQLNLASDFLAVALLHAA